MFSKKDKDAIRDIIRQWSIVSICTNDKEIWDCNGKETPLSREYSLSGNIKNIEVDEIVKEILKYITYNCIS